MPTQAERAEALASKKRRLVAVRAAIESFLDNMAVQEYSREDRAAKYARLAELENTEKRLENDIAALEKGGGRLRQVYVGC